MGGGKSRRLEVWIGVPFGVAVDSTGNIYVANSASFNGGPDTVTAFPPLASLTGQPNYPDVTPYATISGAGTGLNSPGGIAVDSGGNLYVTNDGSVNGGADSVTVYAAGANGNAAPSATISGGATGLDVPFGVAIDSGGNLYVASDGSADGGADSVTVYPAGSSGNAAPSATISSDAGLEAPAGSGTLSCTSRPSGQPRTRRAKIRIVIYSPVVASTSG